MATQTPSSNDPESRQSVEPVDRQADLARMWHGTLGFMANAVGARAAWMKIGAPLNLSVSAGNMTDGIRSHVDAIPLEAASSTSDQPATVIVAGCTTYLRTWANETAGSGVLIALCFGDDRPLSGADIARLDEMSGALVASVRQSFEARRLTENLDRVRHLYDVGQAIASTLDLDQVLRHSTARVTAVLHAESSALILVDEQRKQLVFKIPAGPAEHMLREQRMPLEKGVAGWVATHGEPLIIADAARDPRWYNAIDNLTGYRTRSIMAVPLQIKGQTIGVIEVVNKVDAGCFGADDLQWLGMLAPLIAAAVDNARLFAALRDEHDRIIAAEEQVRHELARNLHDGPAQILAAIILNIDMARRQLAAGPEKMAKELNFLESLAQEANHEIRDLLFSLRPIILETHGLKAALTQLIERLQPHVTYPLHLDVGELGDEPLELRVSGTVFVIIQEALNNIQKHAQPQNVWIHLSLADQLSVSVADDGLGFSVKDVEANYERRNSFGLLNMRERARLIDAQLEVFSPRPGDQPGTLVRLEVPLQRAASIL